jgi:hypothetical protein
MPHSKFLDSTSEFIPGDPSDAIKKTRKLHDGKRFD